MSRDENVAVMIAGMFPDDFTAEEVFEGMQAERRAIAEVERREAERHEIENSVCPCGAGCGRGD